MPPPQMKPMPLSRGDRKTSGNNASVKTTSKQQQLEDVEDKLISRRQDLTYSYPRRPAYGSAGNDITLIANYFAVNAGSKKFVTYNINVILLSGEKKQAVENGSPTGGKLKAIVEEAIHQIFPDQSTAPPYASDFKSQLVLLQDVPKLHTNNSYEVVHKQRGSTPEKRYEVIFTKKEGGSDLSKVLESLRKIEYAGTSQLYTKLTEEVRPLNTVLGYLSRDTMKTIGTNRFFPLEGGERRSLGDFEEVVLGFTQMVRPATGRLLLNASMTASVFRKPERLSLIIQEQKLDIMDTAGLSESHRQEKVDSLNSKLAGARIIYEMPQDNGEHKSISMRLSALAAVGPKRWTFQLPTNDVEKKFSAKLAKEVKKRAAPGVNQVDFTVADYFKFQYGKIVNPRLPLVIVGSGNTASRFPAELCSIQAGQPTKTNPMASGNMNVVKLVSRPPRINFPEITKGRKLLGWDDGFLKNFGVSIDMDMINIQARRLPSPQVIYSERKTMKTEGGDWNLKEVKVLESRLGDRTNWNYVYFTRDERECADIQKSALHFGKFMAENMGLGIKSEPELEKGIKLTGNMETIETEMTKRLANKKVRGFYLVVLPTFSRLGVGPNELHKTFKQLGDVEFGIHTFCVKADKFKRRDDSIFANIGMKINTKLGGRNHGLLSPLPLMNRPTMVVGYDVIHPTGVGFGGANDSSATSYAAMVASVGPSLDQWPSVSWDNGARVEKLKDKKLQEAFESRLQLFADRTKLEPQNILIYRDGVAESQFEDVLKELDQMKEVCARRYKGKDSPRICLVVAIKRHSTRLAKKGTLQNPDSGTVVDRGITMAGQFDFYLQAHRAIAGTARPCHYVVLHDEIFRYNPDDPQKAVNPQKAVDDLQTFTNNLCSLFGRAPKAVSVCPPVYYADLACTRAQMHAGQEIHKDVRNDMFYL